MFAVSVLAAAAAAAIDFDAASRIYRNVEFVHDHMDSMLGQYAERCVLKRVTVEGRLRVVGTMKQTQYAILMKTGDTEIVIKSVDTKIPMMIPSLAMEKGVLRELRNDSLFPRLYDVSPDSGDFGHPTCYYRTLFNSFVGTHSFASTQKKMTRKNLYLVAARIMEAIQETHRLGVVHGDIHDQNIIIGDFSDPAGSLRIIDFGESRLFVNPFSKLHIEEIIDPSNQTFKRTVHTATPWEILGFPKSRRDDFYRVANLLLRFVGSKKSSSRLPQSLSGLQGPERLAYSFCAFVDSRYPAFIELMKEACSLGFQDEPNYGKWSTEFRRLAAETSTDQLAFVDEEFSAPMDVEKSNPKRHAGSVNPFASRSRPGVGNKIGLESDDVARIGKKPLGMRSPSEAERQQPIGDADQKQPIDNPFGTGRGSRPEREVDQQPYTNGRRPRPFAVQPLPRVVGDEAEGGELEVKVNPCDERDGQDEILKLLCPSFDRFRRNRQQPSLPSARSVLEIRTGQVRGGSAVSSVDDMSLGEDTVIGSCSLSSSSVDSEIVHIFAQLSSSESLADQCVVSISPPMPRSLSPTIMDGLDLNMASRVHGRLSPAHGGTRAEKRGISALPIQQGACDFLSPDFQVFIHSGWKSVQFTEMLGAKGSGDSVFFHSVDGSIVIKHITSSRNPLIMEMLGTEKAVYSILAELPTGHPLLQYTIKPFEFKYPPGTPEDCYARTLVTAKALGSEVKQFDGQLSPKQIAHIVSEVVEGLRLLHAIGIVHGDIHWKNVMLATPEGRITIIDFGRARSFIDDEMQNVALPEYTDLFCITRGYLSPFELEHFPAMPRDDVYRAVEMAFILTQRKLEKDSCPSRKRYFDDAQLAEEKRHALLVGPEWEPFMAFHREIIQLEYSEKPDYHKWRRSFAAVASAWRSGEEDLYLQN